MKTLSLAGLVTSAFIAAAALGPGQARAVPLGSGAAPLATVDVANGVEQVHYRRYRRPYYRYRPYRRYRPYYGYYRPYRRYRPYYRYYGYYGPRRYYRRWY